MRGAAWILAGCSALLVATGSLAAEVGCERLAWNLDAERALMAAATEGDPGAVPPLARRLAARPLADAGLPRPPERAPREPDARAAHTTVSVAEAGLYRVTLDSDGWLDVVQDGVYRRAEAFTGVRGCPGIRKSVRFRLDAAPAIIQVTGASAPSVTVAVTRER